MKRSLLVSILGHVAILALLAIGFFLAEAPPPEPRMVEVELRAAAPPPPTPPSPRKPEPKPEDKPKPPEPPRPPPTPPPPVQDDNIVPVPLTPQRPLPDPPKPPDTPPPEPEEPPTKPTPPNPPAVRLGDDVSNGYVEDNGTGASCKSKRNLYPVFPPIAAKRGEAGDVTLRLHIDSNGDVLLAEILNSSGHALLDQAARDRLATWHCDPAMQDGKPVLNYFDITIHFLPE